MGVGETREGEAQGDPRRGGGKGQRGISLEIEDQGQEDPSLAKRLRLEALPETANSISNM